jgi:hypothetical protein
MRYLICGKHDKYIWRIKIMNNELLDALTILEKEKNISKETLLEAIENSLLTACKTLERLTT